MRERECVRKSGGGTVRERGGESMSVCKRERRGGRVRENMGEGG